MSTMFNTPKATLLKSLILAGLAGWMMLNLSAGLAWADDLTINSLEFSSLSGGIEQIRLEMSGPAVEPKIFQTDNPARLALDFEGTKSNLAKKSFPLNKTIANTVYVMEASGRTRIIINLLDNAPYETHVDGNTFYVRLKPTPSKAFSTAATKQTTLPPPKSPAISRLLPDQSIKSVDFRRGPNGEGRLVLGLSKPDTVVDARQVGGKVILNFLNTTVAEGLVKRFDVSDFASPVHKFDVNPKGENVEIVVTPSHPNFDYSSYQSDNILTVDFRPLTPAEKEAQLKAKMPYIGSKLSLNFQDIEVRSVLMILADHIKTQEGKEVNIVTTDSVAGSMALHVNDVPWDQVLDVVMKLRGLSKRENGNVILVGPTEEIKVIEEKELEARRVQQELEPLKTENIQINYARADNICAILLGRSVTAAQGNAGFGGGQAAGGGGGGGGAAGGGAGGACGGMMGGMMGGMGAMPPVAGGVAGGAGANPMMDMRLLSPRGSVIADGRTNILIVKDTATQMEEIRKMIAKLDIPVRQVMIEARVVIANTRFARDLGVRFGVNNNRNAATETGALANLGYTLAGASPPGLLAMTLASGANYLLSLEIEALQNEGRGEQLSNPRILTSDNQPAHIEQGRAIPFTTVSMQGTNTEFIDASLVMNVTPQITPSGSIIMEINVSKDAQGAVIPQAQGGQAVAIEKKNVRTRVQVEDGETVVLGGVYESDVSNTRNAVPWFADLPVLGWLFTPQKNVSDEKTELLIFVTPKIVKSTASLN